MGFFGHLDFFGFRVLFPFRVLHGAYGLFHGHFRDLEVFLAERAPELRFFGGYWAMPGGTLAKEDLGTGLWRVMTNQRRSGGGGAGRAGS